MKRKGRKDWGSFLGKMIKIKNKRVYNDLIDSSKKSHKERVEDEEDWNLHIQNQKERIIFYLIFIEIIFSVFILFWHLKSNEKKP